MEIEFIQALARGDMHAYRLLYSLYWHKVRSFVIKMTGEDWLAEEISQNVFVKIWNNRQRLNSESSDTLSGYIFTIARNEIMDWHRQRSKIRKFQENFAAEICEEISMPENIDADKMTEIINSEVSNMPPVRREVFISSRWLDLSNQEISDKLNISKRTVEKHLNLALKHLRCVLSEYFKKI